jgi:hypothetical protein
VQTIHGHVERMAIEIKAHRGAGVFPQQIKRIAGPLQGRLKGHFGMVADLVTGMTLALGRGGSDDVKLRTAREYVGQIRQALDVAAYKVAAAHTTIDAPAEEPASS